MVPGIAADTELRLLLVAAPDARSSRALRAAEAGLLRARGWDVRREPPKRRDPDPPPVELQATSGEGDLFARFVAIGDSHRVGGPRPDEDGWRQWEDTIIGLRGERTPTLVVSLAGLD